MPSLSPDEREAAADYADALELYIAPGDQEMIALRIAALRAHWRPSDNESAVEDLMAIDWTRAIGLYPMWAVVEACESWVDGEVRPPRVAEIKRRCDQAVSRYVLFLDIMRKALAA